MPSETRRLLIGIHRKLKRLLERQTTGDPRFFSVDQAAVYSSLSPESIRRLLAAGKLTALRPCKGRVLVDRRQLESVVLGSTRKLAGGRGQHERA